MATKAELDSALAVAARWERAQERARGVSGLGPATAVATGPAADATYILATL
jgi:hypothetical protein